MKEASLKTATIKHLRALYGADIVVEKRFGSGYGANGQPDLNICIAGGSVQIELKTDVGELTELQKLRLEQWAQAGAVVGVARSVHEAVGIVERARTTFSKKRVIVK